MKRSPFLGQKPYWLAFVLVPLLLFVLACGGEEATPTPAATATATATAMATATATATKAPTATPTTGPAATPTPTRAGPTATPTPTVVATPTPTPGVQPQRGGSLIQTTSTGPIHWDLQIYAAGSHYAHPYNNLFYNPHDDVITCELCKEWHLENGGKTMVFNMIQGIKFHDGREMTSADVAYSLNKIMGQIDGIISVRCGVIKEYIDSITTPSKYELRINLVRPTDFLPKVLSTFYCVIYPNGTTRADLQSKPYGSGPWLVTNMVSGAGYTLERNPNYFKPGLPYLDKVQMQIAAADASAAAFETHRTDFHIVAEPGTTLTRLLKMAGEGKVGLRKAPTGCNPSGMFMNVSKPPFSDINVRKASYLALDRVGYGQAIWGGDYLTGLLFRGDSEWGRPVKEIWNVVPGWGTGAKKQQEIEQGKQLLITAGYAKGIDVDQMNQGGVRITAQSELIQGDLAKIGIRTTIKTVGGAAEADPKRANLDYFMEAGNKCQTTMDPDEMIGSYWITGAARNVFGYYNPEVDRLYLLMSAETDHAKRVQLVRQLEDIIILKDFAHGGEPENYTQHFWWPRLHNAGGMGLTPPYGSGMGRWEQWWIDQSAGAGMAPDYDR
ncbi:MAG: ABC transporter substrate-binding protein [Chloroflexota bacterium]